MEQRDWPRDDRDLQHRPIQVRVASVDRIFNAMDPSPLEERSLDIEVADWIEEWAEDLDGAEPITIEVMVSDRRLEGREQAITDAVHNHFEYREWQASRALSKLWREGRVSLVIGVVAIAAFNGAARLIDTSTNPFIEILHSGLNVLGWVSMWKPLEIFLYEWWPIRRELRALRRLAVSDVTFPPAPTRQPAG